MNKHHENNPNHNIQIFTKSCEIRCLECEIEILDTHFNPNGQQKISVFNFRKFFFPDLNLSQTMAFPNIYFVTGLILLYKNDLIRKIFKRIYKTSQQLNDFDSPKPVFSSLGILLGNLFHKFEEKIFESTIIYRIYEEMIQTQTFYPFYSDKKMNEYLHSFLDTVGKKTSMPFLEELLQKRPTSKEKSELPEFEKVSLIQAEFSCINRIEKECSYCEMSSEQKNAISVIQLNKSCAFSESLKKTERQKQSTLSSIKSMFNSKKSQKISAEINFWIKKLQNNSFSTECQVCGKKDLKQSENFHINLPRNLLISVDQLKDRSLYQIEDILTLDENQKFKSKTEKKCEKSINDYKISFFILHSEKTVDHCIYFKTKNTWYKFSGHSMIKMPYEQSYFSSLMTKASFLEYTKCYENVQTVKTSLKNDQTSILKNWISVPYPIMCRKYLYGEKIGDYLNELFCPHSLLRQFQLKLHQFESSKYLFSPEFNVQISPKAFLEIIYEEGLLEKYFSCISPDKINQSCTECFKTERKEFLEETLRMSLKTKFLEQKKHFSIEFLKTNKLFLQSLFQSKKLKNNKIESSNKEDFNFQTKPKKNFEVNSQPFFMLFEENDRLKNEKLSTETSSIPNSFFSLIDLNDKLIYDEIKTKKVIDFDENDSSLSKIINFSAKIKLHAQINAHSNSPIFNNCIENSQMMTLTKNLCMMTNEKESRKSKENTISPKNINYLNQHNDQPIFRHKKRKMNSHENCSVFLRKEISLLNIKKYQSATNELKQSHFVQNDSSFNMTMLEEGFSNANEVMNNSTCEVKNQNMIKINKNTESENKLNRIRMIVGKIEISEFGDSKQKMEANNRMNNENFGIPKLCLRSQISSKKLIVDDPKSDCPMQCEFEPLNDENTSSHYQNPKEDTPIALVETHFFESPFHENIDTNQAFLEEVEEKIYKPGYIKSGQKSKFRNPKNNSIFNESMTSKGSSHDDSMLFTKINEQPFDFEEDHSNREYSKFRIPSAFKNSINNYVLGDSIDFQHTFEAKTNEKTKKWEDINLLYQEVKSWKVHKMFCKNARKNIKKIISACKKQLIDEKKARIRFLESKNDGGCFMLTINKELINKPENIINLASSEFKFINKEEKAGTREQYSVFKANSIQKCQAGNNFETLIIDSRPIDASRVKKMFQKQDHEYIEEINSQVNSAEIDILKDKFELFISETSNQNKHTLPITCQQSSKKVSKQLSDENSFLSQVFTRKVINFQEKIVPIHFSSVLKFEINENKLEKNPIGVKNLFFSIKEKEPIMKKFPKTIKAPNNLNSKVLKKQENDKMNRKSLTPLKVLKENQRLFPIQSKENIDPKKLKDQK